MGTFQHLFSRKPFADPIDDFVRKSSHEEPGACDPIVALGASVVDRLIPLLGEAKNHPFAVRCNTIRALRRIGDLRAVEPLMSLLQDTDNMIRIEAAQALGGLKDARAVPSLIALLGHGYALSSAAARALGLIGDSQAVEPLIKMLDDYYECGREAAAEALGYLHDQRAIAPLVQTLHDDDHAMRKLAADALERIGWRPPDPEMKATHLVALQNWSGCVLLGRDAVPQLIRALRSSDFETTWNAGNALVAIGQPAVEALRASLSDGNADFRADVTRILGQIGARVS
ncbi:MAG TPA: HEAT repeat domain-containing protein [Anaerolineae bacterium]|jgi:HEAT repeat protein